MRWKLFALFNFWITSWNITHTFDLDLDTIGIINLAFEAIATTGLVLMACELKFLPREFWRGLAGAYAAFFFVTFAVSGIVVFHQQRPIDGLGAVAYFFFHLAVGYGLWLNGARQDQREQVQFTA